MCCRPLCPVWRYWSSPCWERNPTTVRDLKFWDFKNILVFSVTCIVVIFRHPSFDMLNKQDRSNSTNHSLLAWPFELVTLKFSIKVTWNKHWSVSFVIGSFQTTCWKTMSKYVCRTIVHNTGCGCMTKVTIWYSWTPLFRTQLIRSAHYFEVKLNFLGFILTISVIYCQLFRTWLFRTPC